MIPVHDLIDKNLSDIRVVKLDALTHYDTTEPHRHNYFELFVFDKGAGVHEIDFVEFPIKSSSIHIVAPGQVHQVRRELDTNGFVVLFETSALDPKSPVFDFLFDRMCYDVEEFSPVYQFSPGIFTSINHSISEMWKDYNSDNKLKNDFMLNNLGLLCIQCMRTIERSVLEANHHQEMYHSFRRLLRTNFKSQRKVKEYAAELNVTEKQLNEIVNAKTGLSTSALIYRQVILEARRLLNTGMPSKEVAYELHFDDPAHFSKFFKNQTGISPSEFSKMQA